MFSHLTDAPMHAEPAPALEWTGERFVPTEGGPEIYYEHAHRYLLAREILAGQVVVDLASGEGYGSAWLADVARVVIGVEIDDTTISHARARYASRANLRFARGDIQAVPLADACADAIVCFEAIEHVPEPRRVVEEAARILKPGGLFLVSTPNKALYSDAREYTNDYHVHEFYLPDFERLLKEFFPDHWLLGQRLIAGSLAWPLAEVTDSGERNASDLGVIVSPGFGETSGEQPSMLEPMYVLACGRQAGGNAAELPGNRASVFVDHEELLLDLFRRSLDPAETQRVLAQLQVYEAEIQLLRTHFGVHEEQREAQNAELQLLRKEHHAEVELLRTRSCTQAAQLDRSKQNLRDLGSLRSSGDLVGALRRQQDLATQHWTHLQAAAELNTRLLAELTSAQKAIVELQLSRLVKVEVPIETVPTPPVPATPLGRVARTWLPPRLIRLARRMFQQ